MRKVLTAFISAAALLLASCAEDGEHVRTANPAFPDRASSEQAVENHDDEVPHQDAASDDHAESDDDPSAHDGQSQQDVDDHEEAGEGSPGDPTRATRVVEIAMLDSMAFDPASIEVAAGATVTFVVTNEGKIEHDFTIGNEATQAAHDEEMAEQAQDDHSHGHEEANAISLHSGETGELTWSFDSPGTLLIGCHIPGHYSAGMVAEVQVS